jgi:hypothetical protein
MMRTALMTGAAAAALALAATAAARAETVFVADMDPVVAPAPGYVYGTDPDYVVEDRSYVVVTPPRERIVVAPRREVIVEQPAYVAPRRQVVVDQPAYVAPRDYVAPRETIVTPRSGYYTTGYSSGCMIDSRGFERCY